MTAEEMKVLLDEIFETDRRLTRVELMELLKTLARIDEQASDDNPDNLSVCQYHAGRYSGLILARSLLRQLEY